MLQAKPGKIRVGNPGGIWSRPSGAGFSAGVIGVHRAPVTVGRRGCGGATVGSIAFGGHIVSHTYCRRCADNPACCPSVDTELSVCWCCAARAALTDDDANRQCSSVDRRACCGPRSLASAHAITSAVRHNLGRWGLSSGAGRSGRATARHVPRSLNPIMCATCSTLTSSGTRCVADERFLIVSPRRIASHGST